jgi:DNA-binding transcriptional ArsR family regulator
MERQVTRIHRALAVLAPVKRFQLLTLILEGVDRSVSQLARAVRLSQSCTTRHLQALERAGLVRGWRDGKRVVFRPAPRDAEAGAVIASLSGADRAEPGTRPPASPPRGALASRGSGRTMAGLDAVPVASTAEREPPPTGGAEPFGSLDPRPRARSRSISPEAVARPHTGEARRGSESLTGESRDDADPARAEAESGISTPAPPPARRWSDLEDFLL